LPVNLDPLLDLYLHFLCCLDSAYLADTFSSLFEHQSDDAGHDWISPTARTCSDERLLELQDPSTLLTSPPASPRSPDHLV
jgi:hypothetical protein